MVLYKCDICNKEFKLRGDFKRHQNRKFPCLNLNPSESKRIHEKSTTEEGFREFESKRESKKNKSKTDNQCFYCKKFYSTSSNLHKHINNVCKIKKNHDKEKEDIYLNLLDDMNNLKDKVNDLEKENNQLKTNSKQTINNTINNTTNNIKLVSFGDEDLDIIPKDIIKQALDYGLKSIPVFTKYLHFNKNSPENHNIYINNIRNKFIMVYKKDNWNLTNQDDILGKLIDFKTDFLAGKFEEYKEDLPNSTLRKFDLFLDQQYEDDVINDVKDELKLILYNNRKLPLKTKQELELIDGDLLVK